jgi:hypothetical protein
VGAYESGPTTRQSNWQSNRANTAASKPSSVQFLALIIHNEEKHIPGLDGPMAVVNF